MSTDKTILPQLFNFFFCRVDLSCQSLFKALLEPFVSSSDFETPLALRSVTHQVLTQVKPWGLYSLRPTRLGESRKHSVPGRVHSVFKNGGFDLFKKSSSNLGLTRGTVESLKIYSLPALCFFMESSRIQSVLRALSQPFCLACGCSPKFF